MSFKRKGPGPLASGAIGAVVGVAIVGCVIALLAIPASANAGSSGEPRFNAHAARTTDHFTTFIAPERN